MSKKTVLMVAEKPSIAQSIAKALSKGPLDSPKGSMPLYTFPGQFNNETVTFKVTSVAGHVFSCDFPKEYQNWDRDSYELFDAPIKRVAAMKGIVKHLERVSKGMSLIVLWLDCDREGENICFEVLSCVFSKNVDMSKVYRAKFSAITERDIKKALEFKNLIKPNKKESDSVDARQELDLKIGVAFSRYQTKYFKNKFVLEEKTEEEKQNKVFQNNPQEQDKFSKGKGRGRGREKSKSSVLSYGPCQMPTLYFCVERLMQIKSFVSEKYFKLSLTLKKDGKKCKAQWARNKVFNSQICRAFLLKASLDQRVKVVEVKSSRTSQSRPLPLNTVSLLKAASSKLGMGPHSAMRSAERLYLSGLLSYPRTESTKYPKSFNFTEIVKMFQNSSHSEYCSELLKGKINYDYKSSRGVDAGDHPPITPCRFSPQILASLGSEESRLYDFVVKHFLASIGSNAIFTQKKIKLKAGSEFFKLSQKTLLKPGFLSAFLSSNAKQTEAALEFLLNEEENKEEEDETQVNFEINEGDTFQLTDNSAFLEVAEGYTKPASLLSESDLISLMEKNGIGTDASISVHIQNIINRNYVALKTAGSRRLEPTKLGLTLIKGYFKIDHDLVIPKVRAQSNSFFLILCLVEQQCNLIAQGKASKSSVLKRNLALFKQKFRTFQEQINIMEKIFGENFRTLADKVMDLGVDYKFEKGRNMIWSRSGKTKAYLIFLPRPDRLYDRKTEETFFLPRGGKITQSNGVMCPKEGCGFEISYFSVGKPSRTYPLCPYCFNQGSQDHRSMLSVSPHEANHPLCSSRLVRVLPDSKDHMILDCKKMNLLIDVKSTQTFSFKKGFVKSLKIQQKLNEEKEHFVKILFDSKNSLVSASDFMKNLDNFTFTGLVSQEEVWKLLSHFPCKEKEAAEQDPPDATVDSDSEYPQTQKNNSRANDGSRVRGKMNSRGRGKTKKKFSSAGRDNDKDNADNRDRGKGRGRGSRRGKGSGNASGSQNREKSGRGRGRGHGRGRGRGRNNGNGRGRGRSRGRNRGQARGRGERGRGSGN